MKRTQFARATFTPAPRQPLKLGQHAPRHVRMSAGSTNPPQPKDEPVRPGKRRPTAAERAWMDAIVAYGCIACRMDGATTAVVPAVHHILSGGQRMGHLFTLPLCDPGHHQNGGALFISRHPWKARFEARYGSELHLLAGLKAALA